MYTYHVVNSAGFPPEGRKVYAYFNANTQRWAYTPARVLARTFSLVDATHAIGEIESQLGGEWKPTQCSPAIVEVKP